MVPSELSSSMSTSKLFIKNSLSNFDLSSRETLDISEKDEQLLFHIHEYTWEETNERISLSVQKLLISSLEKVVISFFKIIKYLTKILKAYL